MTPTTLEPKVIAEYSDFVVLEKPAGLLVHAGEGTGDEETLADWVLRKYPETATVGDEPALRPGIVHRLDRDTSGLMVIARTQKMFEGLKVQFQEHTIEKEYFALVHGVMKNEFGEINLPISRASRGGRMAAHGAGTEDAHEARTEYFVDTRFTTATLLRVVIHTGRTHQIRVHMFALQHPVVGDALYPVKKTGKSFPQPPRLFLHSARLAFTDSAGERHEFTSPLPQELTSYLTLLKKV